MNLYKSLRSYCTSDIYPMHMPGHKRNPVFQMEDPYRLDVTEVDGTDNLHHPEGMIRRLMDQIKHIYGTEESYLLVNGSTCGVLAAVSSCVQRGDTVIMDRNCHRSVYHAVYLLELKPVYLYPDVDAQTGIALGIRSEQVREALRERPEAACVIVTSPTYEGVISDIQGISEEVHQREIPLIVDEAHGAHLTWGHPVWSRIPRSAVQQGADLVVESLHKTLPALTQTGMLHRCSDRIDAERIERYLAIYESSSPSYILMASAAQCIDWMELHGEEAFRSYRKSWQSFYRQSQSWQCFSLWDHLEKDPTRLVILGGSLTGQKLSGILRERYQIQMEMASANYVLALTTICDMDQGWQRLADALTEIDREQMTGGRIQAGLRRERWQNIRGGVGDTVEKGLHRMPGKRIGGAMRKSLYAAMNSPYECIRTEDSVGRTAAEYAFLYPPGIPFLVPGEEITGEVRELLWHAREKKLHVMGMEDVTGEYIRVCAE